VRSSDSNGLSNAIKRVSQLVESYNKFKKDYGLEGQVGTEQSLGALFSHGGQTYGIGGTLDQLWYSMNTLTDFKTTSGLTPDQALQLNMLRLILGANGIEMPNSMKLIGLPLRGGNRRVPAMANVMPMSPEDVVSFLGNAIDMDQNSESSEIYQKALKKNIEIMRHTNGGLQSVLTVKPAEFTPTGTNRHVRYNDYYINENRLGDLLGDGGRLSADEIIGMIDNLPAHDAALVKHKLFQAEHKYLTGNELAEEKTNLAAKIKRYLTDDKGNSVRGHSAADPEYRQMLVQQQELNKSGDAGLTGGYKYDSPLAQQLREYYSPEMVPAFGASKEGSQNTDLASVMSSGDRDAWTSIQNQKTTALAELRRLRPTTKFKMYYPWQKQMTALSQRMKEYLAVPGHTDKDPMYLAMQGQLYSLQSQRYDDQMRTPWEGPANPNSEYAHWQKELAQLKAKEASLKDKYADAMSSRQEDSASAAQNSDSDFITYETVALGGKGNESISGLKFGNMWLGQWVDEYKRRKAVEDRYGDPSKLSGLRKAEYERLLANGTSKDLVSQFKKGLLKDNSGVEGWNFFMRLPDLLMPMSNATGKELDTAIFLAPLNDDPELAQVMKGAVGEYGDRTLGSLQSSAQDNSIEAMEAYEDYMAKTRGNRSNALGPIASGLQTELENVFASPSFLRNLLKYGTHADEDTRKSDLEQQGPGSWRPEDTGTTDSEKALFGGLEIDRQGRSDILSTDNEGGRTYNVYDAAEGQWHQEDVDLSVLEADSASVRTQADEMLRKLNDVFNGEFGKQRITALQTQLDDINKDLQFDANSLGAIKNHQTQLAGAEGAYKRIGSLQSEIEAGKKAGAPGSEIGAKQKLLDQLMNDLQSEATLEKDIDDLKSKAADLTSQMKDTQAANDELAKMTPEQRESMKNRVGDRFLHAIGIDLGVSVDPIMLANMAARSIAAFGSKSAILSKRPKKPINAAQAQMFKEQDQEIALGEMLFGFDNDPSQYLESAEAVTSEAGIEDKDKTVTNLDKWKEKYGEKGYNFFKDVIKTFNTKKGFEHTQVGNMAEFKRELNAQAGNPNLEDKTSKEAIGRKFKWINTAKDEEGHTIMELASVYGIPFSECHYVGNGRIALSPEAQDVVNAIDAANASSSETENASVEGNAGGDEEKLRLPVLVSEEKQDAEGAPAATPATKGGRGKGIRGEGGKGGRGGRGGKGGSDFSSVKNITVTGSPEIKIFTGAAVSVISSGVGGYTGDDKALQGVEGTKLVSALGQAVRSAYEQLRKAELQMRKTELGGKDTSGDAVLVANAKDKYSTANAAYNKAVGEARYHGLSDDDYYKAAGGVEFSIDQVGELYDAKTRSAEQDKAAQEAERQQKQNLADLQAAYKDILEMMREIAALERDITKATRQGFDVTEQQVALDQKRRDLAKRRAEAEKYAAGAGKKGAEATAAFANDSAAQEQADKVANERGTYSDILAMRRQYTSELQGAGNLRNRIKTYQQEAAITPFKLKRESDLDEADSLQKYLDEDQERIAKLRSQLEKLGQGDWLKGQNEAELKKLGIADAQRNNRFGGATTVWEQLNAQLQNTISRFLAYGLAYKIIGTVTRGFQKLAQSAQDLNKAMVNLQVVTGDTSEQAKDLLSNYAKMGEQLGATTAEVAEAANDWLRQGYSIEKVNDLVTSSLYLSKLGMISSATATQDLTSAMKGFKLSAEESMNVVSQLTQLDMDLAASAGDIADALKETANVAQQVGLSIQKTEAMVGVMIDVSQEGASTSGTALKTILSRYTQVKAGKFEGDASESGESVNDVETVLKKVGVAIRDANGEFKSFDTVMGELNDKWATFDSVTQSAIATAMAGTRQREQFLILMNNYDRVMEEEKKALNSSGVAEEKYLSYSDQLEASQKRLQAAWESIANDTDFAGFLKTLTDVMEKAVKFLPIIIKEAAVLFTYLQSYKIPTMLRQTLDFFGFSKDFNLKGNPDLMDAAINRNKREQEWIRQQSGKSGSDAFKDSLLGTTGITKIQAASTSQVNALVANTAALQANTAAVGMHQHSESESAIADIGKKGGRAFVPSAQSSSNADLLLGAPSEESYSSMKESLMPSADSIITDMQKDPRNRTLGSDFIAADEIKKARRNARRRASYAKKKQAKLDEAQHKKDVKEARKAGIKSSIASGVVAGVAEGTTVQGTHINAITGEEEANPTTSTKTKVAAGVTSGVLTAGLGALGAMVGLGPLGATIGSALGSFIGPRWGRVFDAENNARADRVKYAQKMLTEVNTLETNTKSIENLTKSSLLSDEDWTSMLAAVKSFEETLNTSTDDLETRLDDILVKGKNATTVRELLATIKDSGSTQAERRSAARQLSAAEAQAENAATIESSEQNDLDLYTKTKSKVDVMRLKALASAKAEDRFAAMQSIGGSGTDASTTRGLLQQLNYIQDTLKKNGDTSSSYYYTVTSQIDTLQSAIDTENEKLNVNYVKIAALETEATTATGNTLNIGDMTTAQLKSVGPDKLIAAVAAQLQANGGLSGMDVYDSSGKLTAKAKKYILNQIKDMGGNLYDIVGGGAYSLRETLALDEGETKDDRLKQFADALGITVEHVKELKDTLGDAKLSDLLSTPAETRTVLTSLNDMFSSLATSSGITVENFENMLSTFPHLIQYMQSGASLAEGIISGLMTNEAVYQSKITQKLLSNEDYFQDFLSGLTPAEKEALGNAQTGADAADMIFGDSSKLSSEEKAKLQERYKQFYDIAIPDTFKQSIAKSMIEYETSALTKQIDNLTAQKDALADINKQREYEIKLIKAQQELENAQKNKTRVYRAGLGYVYATDQSAVAEKQSALDELKNEQDVSRVGLQITELTAQKDALSKIITDAEEAGQKAAWEAFASSQGIGDKAIGPLIETLSNYYGAKINTNGSTVGGETADKNVKAAQGIASDIQNVMKLRTAKEEAAEKYGKGSQEYAEAEKAYNNAVGQYTTDLGNYSGSNDTLEAELKSAGLASNATEDQTLKATSSSALTPYTIPSLQDDGHTIYYHVVLTQDAPSSTDEKDLWNDDSYVFTPDGSGGYVRSLMDRGNYKSITSWAQDQSEGTVLFRHVGDGNEPMVMIHNKMMYHLGDVQTRFPGNYYVDDDPGLQYVRPNAGGYALGTLNAAGGATLVNELGTEGIVTPQGTMTALPAHTGVVPSDITRNVAELGYKAPELVKSLDTITKSMIVSNNAGADNSTTVGSITVSINADGSFNVDKFVDELKTRVALTKNQNR
jgi:TP901 family phage tail tape measure protein